MVRRWLDEPPPPVARARRAAPIRPDAHRSELLSPGLEKETEAAAMAEGEEDKRALRVFKRSGARSGGRLARRAKGARPRSQGLRPGSDLCDDERL